MIVTCAGALLALLLAHLIGAGFVRLVRASRPRDELVDAAAPLLGVALALALLDGVGLVLPLRVSAWLVPLLGLVALVVLAKGGVLRAPPWYGVVCVLLGVVVGAVPTAIAGRATAVALTNDDATFYLAGAERLVQAPWLPHLQDGRGVECLSEAMIHGWLWRTGLANLIGSVIVVGRVDGTVAVAIVTAMLTGLTAQAALALAATARLGPRASRARAACAVAVVLSAAPVFLAWQHLLGQLFAFAMFPAALVAISRAALRGGARRLVVAALLVGAAMNGFADAGAMMFLSVAAALALGGRRALALRIGRAAAVGGLAAATFPVTFWRAAWAAFGTLYVRSPNDVRGLFPQRGWLGRSPLDDAATLVGVDPWPPWPAPWPPTLASGLELVATVAGVALLSLAVVRRRRRPGLLVAVGVTLGILVLTRIAVTMPYLRAKCYLFEASLFVPAAALGALSSPRRWTVLLPFALWLGGELVAVGQLARPSGFHMIDGPDHDRLSGALSRIPAGSLLVLDGFGAPVDAVHDEHRAMRAAHRNGLVPIQPGLDGGFFKPICEDPAWTEPPAVGWALQRDSTESLSTGAVVEQFGRFTLRRVDLTSDEGVAGTWAPTHGWLHAEKEPTGTVFRWAERLAAGTLRVVSHASCGRLTGQLRSVDAAGSYSISVSGAEVAAGALTPTWTPFRTRAFLSTGALPVEIRSFVAASDAAHAVAVEDLGFSPDGSCLNALARKGEPPRDDLFPDALGGVNDYALGVVSGVRCGVVLLTVEAPTPGGVLVTTGSDRTLAWTTSGGPTLEAASFPLDLRQTSTVTVQRIAPAEAPAWHVRALRVRPQPCEDGTR